MTIASIDVTAIPTHAQLGPTGRLPVGPLQASTSSCLVFAAMWDKARELLFQTAIKRKVWMPATLRLQFSAESCCLSKFWPAEWPFVIPNLKQQCLWCLYLAHRYTRCTFWPQAPLCDKSIQAQIGEVWGGDLLLSFEEAYLGPLLVEVINLLPGPLLQEE